MFNMCAQLIVAEHHGCLSMGEKIYLGNDSVIYIYIYSIPTLCDYFPCCCFHLIKINLFKLKTIWNYFLHDFLNA